MKNFSKSFAGFRLTKVGEIFSISFRMRVIFLKVGSDIAFFRGRPIPLSEVKRKWVERSAGRKAKAGQ